MYQPPIAGAYARRLVGVKMKYAFELLAGKIVHRFENGGSNLHSVKSVAHLGMDEIDWVQVWLRHGSVMLRSAAQESVIRWPRLASIHRGSRVCLEEIAHADAMRYFALCAEMY
jgi:hypothetical protein